MFARGVGIWHFDGNALIARQRGATDKGRSFCRLDARADANAIRDFLPSCSRGRCKSGMDCGEEWTVRAAAGWSPELYPGGAGERTERGDRTVVDQVRVGLRKCKG